MPIGGSSGTYHATAGMPSHHACFAVGISTNDLGSLDPQSIGASESGKRTAEAVPKIQSPSTRATADAGRLGLHRNGFIRRVFPLLETTIGIIAHLQASRGAIAGLATQLLDARFDAGVAFQQLGFLLAGLLHHFGLGAL